MNYLLIAHAYWVRSVLHRSCATFPLYDLDDLYDLYDLHDLYDIHDLYDLHDICDMYYVLST